MDLTFLGPSAAVVIVVLAFLKFMGDDRKRSEIQHNETIGALKKVADASDKMAAAGRENSRLIKNLNGKLQKAIIDKHEENYPEG